ncbi:MAG: hypothetical protein ABI072_04340 [Edaphobacter sp.]
MRRLLSISLLLLFLLPLVSPLFATTLTEANVPACCRRNGKHHCTMGTALQPSSAHAPGLQPITLRETCPYTLLSQVPATLAFTPDEIQSSIHVGIVSHPTCQAQPATLLTISFDRSRQKRGPPVTLPSFT